MGLFCERKCFLSQLFYEDYDEESFTSKIFSSSVRLCINEYLTRGKILFLNINT